MPKESCEPVTIMRKGKPVKETTVSTSIHMRGFLKALENLKTTVKIDFKTAFKSSQAI